MEPGVVFSLWPEDVGKGSGESMSRNMQTIGISRGVVLRIVVVVAVAIFMQGRLAALGAGGDSRPNFIVIIGDDISWNDFGCYGHPTIRTPNVDRLAERGLRFSRAFLTASSCSPSRCSIITGRYPHNTGAAELHSTLPANQVAFPKLLKDAGYYTAQAGKWHFGDMGRPGGPALAAFDRTGGSIQDGGGPGGEGRWVQWLRERDKDKPFFMWFAAHDAHRGWDDEVVGEAYGPDEVVVPPFLVDDEATRKDLAAYYNEISRMDHYVGLVFEELRRQGVADNTMVIVMADNGRPFPRCKTRVYDSGMQTSLVIHWPDGIGSKGAGAVCESLVSSIDIAPTILELAGVKVPASVQGVSFAEMLTDPKASVRRYVFSEHNWHDYEAYERQVRTERYMYVRNMREKLANQGPADSVNSSSHASLLKMQRAGRLTDAQKDVFMAPRDGEELFDVVKDPLQLHNLAGDGEHAVVLGRLRKVLDLWQLETADTVPDDLTGDRFGRNSGKVLKGVDWQRGTMPGSELDASRTTAKGPVR